MWTGFNLISTKVSFPLIWKCKLNKICFYLTDLSFSFLTADDFIDLLVFVIRPWLVGYIQC